MGLQGSVDGPTPVPDNFDCGLQARVAGRHQFACV
jgi:hypothetical protein